MDVDQYDYKILTLTELFKLTVCIDRCNKKPNTTIPGCDEEEQELYESSGYCGILLDKNGPFAVCHRKVNPNVRHKHTHSHRVLRNKKQFPVLMWEFVTQQLYACLQNYFKDCIFDLCELDGAKPILCEAIEAYVNECQDRGVNIGPWRNETFCRECWVNKWTSKFGVEVKTFYTFFYYLWLSYCRKSSYLRQYLGEYQRSR